MSDETVSTPKAKNDSGALKLRLFFFGTLSMFPVIGEAITMSSCPKEISGWFAALAGAAAGLVLLVSFAVGICSLLFMLLPATRAGAVMVASVCLFSFVAVIGGAGTSRFVRMFGFEQLAQRTKPLITAIEKYEKSVGHPPDELEDLVPEYISRVPVTGIGAYPKYGYTRLKDERDPWELSVSCSSGFLNWDEFFYRPSKKYGKRYGGWIEPVGEWAYFHE